MQVVLAEDNGDLRSLLADLLRGDGHAVTEVRDGNELAALLVNGSKPWPNDDAVVVSDLRMPGQSGLSVLRSSRALARRPQFIMMTGFGDEETCAEATSLGAIGVFDKCTGLQELRRMVATLARRRT
jgi:DNA-binding response OmpR family regulator